ncbi:MAG: hypothetical protein Q4A52_03755 [Bacillota bacterium]|nr:hypothetical protein [Bacillota bacterium]
MIASLLSKKTPCEVNRTAFLVLFFAFIEQVESIADFLENLLDLIVDEVVQTGGIENIGTHAAIGAKCPGNRHERTEMNVAPNFPLESNRPGVSEKKYLKFAHRGSYF